MSAFFMRLENVKNSQARTIDEIVFFRMGTQLVDDLSQYHTVPYGQELSASGRDLPDYFFKPLFKHPPVFTFLIALSMKMFGVNMVSAGYVSLLLSVLMIPLIYFFGAALFGRAGGLFAAFLLWMDPVSIICSQKVWMDSGIAFFTFLSAMCFILAVKNKIPWLFIASGIAAGLAVNTKYTGVLIIFSFIVYAAVYDPALFKKRQFQIGVLILPFLMLVPWFLWNLTVFGTGNIVRLVLGHSELRHIAGVFQQHLFLLVIVPCVVLLLGLVLQKIFIAKKSLGDMRNSSKHSTDFFEKLTWLFALCFVFGMFYDNIFRSFTLWEIPFGTWYQGAFVNEPPKFYIGRLIEFSALYIFGMISLLTFHRTDRQEEALVRLSAVVILGFFILWGNYQSRYILSAVPFVILLSADMLMKWARWVEVCPVIPRLIMKCALISVVSYAVTKTWLINLLFSFPNDMCYF